MCEDKRARIRALNDQFRKHPYHGHGRAVATQSVSALGSPFLQKVLDAIAAFDDFSADNDPHSEHDFGSVMVDTVKILWKIDYYDLDQRYHSEDAADPAKTTRVMTIMLPEDY